MSTEQRLLSDLSIIVEGDPLPIESGSGRISNPTGFSREGNASTVGPHAFTEKRMVPEVSAKLQFTEGFDPTRLTGIEGATVTARQGGRRCLLRPCTLAEVSEIGGGGVDIKILVLGTPQWL